MRTFRWILLLACCAPACHAVEPYRCRNGFFPSAVGSIREAAVVASAHAKATLRSDAKGCPESDACIAATLSPGAHVLVSTEDDGWSCAWFTRGDEEQVGWMRSTDLTTVARRAVVARDWVGRWESVGGGPWIAIGAAVSARGVRTRGRAVWYGALLDSGEHVVHFGRFDADAVPDGDRLVADDGQGCIVRMQRIGRNLVVGDNAGCGGLNVRFDGVYRRRPLRAGDR